MPPPAAARHVDFIKRCAHSRRWGAPPAAAGAGPAGGTAVLVLWPGPRAWDNTRVQLAGWAERVSAYSLRPQSVSPCGRLP